MPEITVHSASIIKTWIHNQVRRAYLGPRDNQKTDASFAEGSQDALHQTDLEHHIINRQRIRDFFFSDLEYRDLTNLARDLDYLMTAGNMECLPGDQKIPLDGHQAAIASSVVQYVRATSTSDAFTQYSLNPDQLLEQLGQAYTPQKKSRQEIRRQVFQRDQRRWGSSSPLSQTMAGETIDSVSADSERYSRENVVKTRWVKAVPVKDEQLSISATRAAMEAYYRLPLQEGRFDVAKWNSDYQEIQRALALQGVQVWVWGAEIGSEQVLQQVHSNLSEYAYSDAEVRSGLVALTFKVLPSTLTGEDATPDSSQPKARVTVAAFLDPVESPSLQNSIDWELIDQLQKADLSLGLNSNQKQLLREIPQLLEREHALDSSHIRTSIFILEQALSGIHQGHLTLQTGKETYLYYQINKLNLLLSQVPEAKIETHLEVGHLEREPAAPLSLKRGLEEAYARFEGLVVRDPSRAVHNFAIYLVENSGNFPDYLNWATDVNAVLYYLNEGGEKMYELARLTEEGDCFYQRMDSLRRLGVFRDASAEFLTRRQLETMSKKGRVLK
ncbi:MAG: hypothetical protein H7A32_03545 [Deltaproteobacteria bacterium]|nr:hypothetical protein [Deltaproteobacteria bacterium]